MIRLETDREVHVDATRDLELRAAIEAIRAEAREGDLLLGGANAAVVIQIQLRRIEQTAILVDLTTVSVRRIVEVLHTARPESILAVIIALAGGGFAATGAATFRRAGTTISPLKPENTSALVVTGVYRVTRNPMYLGLLCVLTAWTLQLGNFVVAAFPVLFVLYMNRFQIGPEERMLRSKFGADFDTYCGRVRRW